jgi:hypothetical protein
MGMRYATFETQFVDDILFSGAGEIHKTSKQNNFSTEWLWTDEDVEQHVAFAAVQHFDFGCLIM